MSVDLVFALLTGLLGFLMARTTLCSVACLQQLVVARRADGVLRLGIACSAAGTILLALALAFPGRIWLPRALPIGLPLILGGMLLGVGAVINGACYLGSVLYLGRGNSNFLFTLVGLVIAFRLAGSVTPGEPSMPMQNVAAFRLAIGPWVWGGLALFALALAASLWLARAAPRRPLVAAAVGALAGLCYARHPDWNYGSVLEALAHASERSISWPAQAAAVMLFAGATAGAATARCWRLQAPSPRVALRCLAGGALMGIGASRIPGGHDVLLLWAIPGLTVYGVLAYFTMAACVTMLLWLGQAVGRAA